MQCIGTALHHLIENGHNIPVCVFDGIKTCITVAFAKRGEIRCYVSFKHGWRKERIDIEAVIRTQRKAVKQVFVYCHFFRIAQFVIQTALCFFFQAFLIFIHPFTECKHIIPVGDFKCAVTVHHQKILVPCFFTDAGQKPQCVFKITRVWMHENGTVVVFFGNFYITVCHIFHMQLLLGFAHLLPLVKPLLRGMNFADGFQSQVKNEFKGRAMAFDGFSSECFYKSFTFCHNHPSGIMLYSVFIFSRKHCNFTQFFFQDFLVR